MFFVLFSIWYKRFSPHRERGEDNTSCVEQTTRRLLKNDPTLTHLKIHGEQLTEGSLRRLCLALHNNDQIQKITLQNMHFDKNWTSQWLVPSLKNKKMLILELEDCSDDHDSALAEGLLRCRHLHSLTIRSCDFEPSHAWGMILKTNHSLTELRISYSHYLFDYDNDANRMTISSLSKGLSCNSTLRSLELSGNALDDVSVSILCQGLLQPQRPGHLNGLAHFSLDFNCFGDAATAHIAQVLCARNCSINELSLFGNRITHVGADSLAKALCCNASLKTLILSLNRIGDAGVAALAHALTVNVTLQNLWIPSNRIGLQGLKVWGDLLPQMHGLEHLNVGMILDQAAADAICSGLQSNVNLSSSHMELAVPNHVEEDDIGARKCDDVDFWLRLNRSGRKVLLRSSTDVSDLSSCDGVPPGLCAKILARSDNASPCLPDVLFYMLKEKPELLGQG